MITNIYSFKLVQKKLAVVQKKLAVVQKFLAVVQKKLAVVQKFLHPFLDKAASLLARLLC